MGRHKVSRDKRKVTTCFTISPRALNILDELSETQSVSMSAIVEEAIENSWALHVNALGGSAEEKQFINNSVNGSK